MPESPISMFGKFVLVLLLAVLLSGCDHLGVWSIPISDEVPGQLESLRSKVTPGETSRQEVHERFGLPFISSERRRVEVFRAASGREGKMAFLVVVPIDFSEEVIIYALILYDDNGVVEEISWDIYQAVPEGFPDHRWMELQAGGFVFAAVKEGSFQRRREILLAPESETNVTLYLRPPPGKCAVLVFLESYYDYTGSKVFLDGEFIAETRYLPKVFIKRLVVEGEHELRVKAQSDQRELRRKLSCEPGSVYYVYPDFELMEIDVNRKTPESHEGWRRVLFHDGKWLGDD